MGEQEKATNDKLWTLPRILATAVVVALISSIGYILIGGGGEIKTESRVVLPGTPVSDPSSKVVPEDFEVRTLDGDIFKLSDYRGKVVVLDFWATWCPPCREEVPQLVRLTRENQARGIEVIGLHIDDRGRSSKEDIRKFAEVFDINYTVGLATNEMFAAYLGEVETAIPQTLVFDRKGNAVAHFVSYTPAHARALDEAVNRALAGGSL
jgi:thiol-disulfide isomerase/thioredoxin